LEVKLMADSRKPKGQPTLDELVRKLEEAEQEYTAKLKQSDLEAFLQKEEARRQGQPK
jgi:polyhydroxyalkanoate synthesis regulator phasin